MAMGVKTTPEWVAQAESLYEEYRDARHEGITLARQSAGKLWQAARFLAEAHDVVPHGQWTEWCQAHDIPGRTASRYVTVGRELTHGPEGLPGFEAMYEHARDRENERRQDEAAEAERQALKEQDELLQRKAEARTESEKAQAEAELVRNTRRMNKAREQMKRTLRDGAALEAARRVAESEDPARALHQANREVTPIPAGYERSNDWYTPAYVMERAHRMLGGIELDAASCEPANAVVKADYYITQREDGLQVPWEARSLWLNPPYVAPSGQNAQDWLCRWIDKAAEAVRSGDVGQALVLVNDNTDTEWFHRGMKAADAALLWRGRIAFWGPRAQDGDSTPPRGNAIFYYGNDRRRFVEVFGKQASWSDA